MRVHDAERPGIPVQLACQSAASSSSSSSSRRRGERIIARGRVIKAGRTLTLAQADVFAEIGGQEKLVALLTATMMSITGRAGIHN
ncbi:hypothetical protein BH11PSE4_BH11PSE4_24720 [soil metagenome]